MSINRLSSRPHERIDSLREASEMDRSVEPAILGFDAGTPSRPTTIAGVILDAGGEIVA